tara:strand:- start:28441 stop:29907 length:1467 start_codon:yes stop_codon:yes gene_type:complete
LKKFIAFLSKDSVLPLLAGLASGLYPWAFYYSNNFKFVNSLEHIYFFLIFFIVLPIISYYLIYFLMRRNSLLLFKRVVLPFVSSFVFFYLSMIALYAQVGYKKIALALFLAVVVAGVCAYVMNLYAKILVVQFLLVLTTFFTLYYHIKPYIFSSDQWLNQPEVIQNVAFKKKPNIYVIQPDGYVNFSELNKGHYNFDNSHFEQWLYDQDFVLYENFRSNYFSTLTSNSSMFAMKHHYLDLRDERKVIMDVNPVVKILNANGYKTHFFAEKPYLIVNRPNISFDYMNFDIEDIPYLSKGLKSNRDILEDLPLALEQEEEANFYFFEKILPGHITTFKDLAKPKEIEREEYLDNLRKANEWLKEIITKISTHDPEAMIVIVADHGGYVGLEYTRQSHIKSQDRDLIYSGFSSALAIKWPGNDIPDERLQFKSSVNLFINLFAHLSEDYTLIEETQDDASYIEIKEGAPTGTYKVIDGEGNIVFEKYEPQK